MRGRGTDHHRGRISTAEGRGSGHRSGRRADAADVSGGVSDQGAGGVRGCPARAEVRGAAPRGDLSDPGRGVGQGSRRASGGVSAGASVLVQGSDGGGKVGAVGGAPNPPGPRRTGHAVPFADGDGRARRPAGRLRPATGAGSAHTPPSPRRTRPSDSARGPSPGPRQATPSTRTSVRPAPERSDRTHESCSMSAISTPTMSSVTGTASHNRVNRAILLRSPRESPLPLFRNAPCIAICIAMGRQARQAPSGGCSPPALPQRLPVRHWLCGTGVAAPEQPRPDHSENPLEEGIELASLAAHPPRGGPGGSGSWCLAAPPWSFRTEAAHPPPLAAGGGQAAGVARPGRGHSARGSPSGVPGRVRQLAVPHRVKHARVARFRLWWVRLW